MDIREIDRKTIEAFRAGGEIEGMHRERLLLLTTVGRVSGQRRWAEIKAAYPFFADYEASTERVIPVVATSRLT